MLKDLIKAWIGKEKKEVHFCDSKETCEQTRVCLNVEYNQALQDLTSRIPELEEMIVGEVKKLLEKEEMEGRSMDLYEKSYSEALRDIITTLSQRDK